MGRYWSSVEKEFPKTQDQPPLDDVRETFDAPTGPQFKVTPLPELRRSWLISKEGSRLIQVQGDRFNFNVRRDPKNPYEGFATHLPEFLRAYEGFASFFQKVTESPVEPVQYELTYVNHVTDGVLKGIADLGRAFRQAQWVPGDFLPPPEVVRWRTSFAMPDRRGRLHVDLQNGVIRGGFGLQFQLTARGYDKSDMKKWFELAHEWIVKGFADLTTQEMHDVWKRES